MKRIVPSFWSFFRTLPKDMCVLVLITPVIFVLADYLAIAPHGITILLYLTDYLFGAVSVGGLAIPLLLVRAFFKKHRQKSLQWAFLCAVWVGLAIPSLSLGVSIRRSAFEKLANRSDALVQAIKQFQIDTGNPPESLENLIPEYFEAVPETGMGAYSKYRYQRGAFAEFKDEAWMLYIHTSSGLMNWDRFVYVPSEVYPEKGESGIYQPIENWAYYHE